MVRKQNVDSKQIGEQIKAFYKTVSLKNNCTSIDKCVTQFTTFYLVIKDTEKTTLTRIGLKIKNIKFKNKIIWAIAFKTDEARKNAYIFWLGISISIPIEAKDGLFHLFGGSYR